MRTEIVLSGYGGQGVVLGGIILAEAAAIYDGINATHNQSYGPEARGGASKSEVIISDDIIHYPEIEHPSVLLCLTQEAFNKFAATVTSDGFIIADSAIQNLNKAGNRKVCCFPIIESAVKEAGSEITTNIVALGVLVGLTQIVNQDALEQAVLSRVPSGTEEINKKAIKIGFRLAKAQ